MSTDPDRAAAEKAEADKKAAEDAAAATKARPLHGLLEGITRLSRSYCFLF